VLIWDVLWHSQTFITNLQTRKLPNIHDLQPRTQPSKLSTPDKAHIMAQGAPLHSLYLQIEYGNSPQAVLGLCETASRSKIHDAYRTIALTIHPDKAPESLRKLHTSLFQKVQAAHDALIESDDGGSSGNVSHPSKQLPETLES